jgi:hypothetical protein
VQWPHGIQTMFASADIQTRHYAGNKSFSQV